MSRFLLLLLLAGFALPPAWPWGRTGHKVTGRIAAARLGAQARSQVARILGVADTPEAVADAMAEASHWADDEARQKYPQAAPWHYINLSLKHGRHDRPDPFLDPHTIYAKIVAYSARLAAGLPDEIEPGSDLKFLLHFVEDLHQPLHSTSNQDRGGNCLLVDSMRNLHAAWDYGLIEEKFGTDDAALAARLGSRYPGLPAGRRRQVEGAGVHPVGALARQWVLESHEYAKEHVYGPLRPRVPRFGPRKIDSCEQAPAALRRTWTLAPSYRAGAAPVIEERLMTAGARLAALLNRIWP